MGFGEASREDAEDGSGVIHCDEVCSILNSSWSRRDGHIKCRLVRIAKSNLVNMRHC